MKEKNERLFHTFCKNLCFDLKSGTRLIRLNYVNHRWVTVNGTSVWNEWVKVSGVGINGPRSSISLSLSCSNKRLVGEQERVCYALRSIRWRKLGANPSPAVCLPQRSNARCLVKQSVPQAHQSLCPTHTHAWTLDHRWVQRPHSLSINTSISDPAFNIGLACFKWE